MIHRTTRERGFTLIELMIVIAVIAVIAAIAIPNLLESRKASNETSAIQALRAIHAAQTLFRERDMDKDGIQNYSNGGGGLRQQRLISANILPDGAGPQTPYHGYMFGVLGTLEGWDPLYEYGALAVPVSPGKSGDRMYFVDDSGVIRSQLITSELTEVPSASELKSWRPIG